MVLVLDNGPIHTSRASTEALAARPWLTVEWLPRYAPELNDIERSWRDLKRHYLAQRTFRDVEHPTPPSMPPFKTSTMSETHQCAQS